MSLVRDTISLADDPYRSAEGIISTFTMVAFGIHPIRVVGINRHYSSHNICK